MLPNEYNYKQINNRYYDCSAYVQYKCKQLNFLLHNNILSKYVSYVLNIHVTIYQILIICFVSLLAHTCHTYIISTTSNHLSRYPYLPLTDRVILPRSSNKLHYPYVWDRIYVNTYRAQRWQRFVSQFNQSNQQHYNFMSHVTKVQAYDGKTLNRSDWVEQGLLATEYPVNRNRTLVRGELASTHTHYTIWQRIIERNLTSGLVLEDDADLDINNNIDLYNNLQYMLEQAGIDQLYDILYLGYNWRPYHHVIDSSAGLFSIPEFKNNYKNATDKYSFHVVHAYVVTNKAAYILTKYAQPYKQPVDVFVGELCGRRILNCVQINPSLINTFKSPSDTQGIV